MKNRMWVTIEEARKLSESDTNELVDLRFKAWADLPLSAAEYDRLCEIEDKIY